MSIRLGRVLRKVLSLLHEPSSVCFAFVVTVHRNMQLWLHALNSIFWSMSGVDCWILHVLLAGHGSWSWPSHRTPFPFPRSLDALSLVLGGTGIILACLFRGLVITVVFRKESGFGGHKKLVIQHQWNSIRVWDAHLPREMYFGWKIKRNDWKQRWKVTIQHNMHVKYLTSHLSIHRSSITRFLPGLYHVVCVNLTLALQSPSTENGIHWP